MSKTFTSESSELDGLVPNKPISEWTDGELEVFRQAIEARLVPLKQMDPALFTAQAREELEAVVAEAETVLIEVSFEQAERQMAVFSRLMPLVIHKLRATMPTSVQVQQPQSGVGGSLPITPVRSLLHKFMERLGVGTTRTRQPQQQSSRRARS